MRPAERSVLHVLPHPGGGGETYVDLLEEMPGYRFSRVFLAPSPRPSLALGRGLADAVRRARGHDLLHVHGEGAAMLCVPLLAVRPSIVTLHGLHVVRRSTGARRSAAALNLRALLRVADRVICVSEAEHAVLTRVVGMNAAKRVLVVHNGVRVPSPPSSGERAAFRNVLGIPEDDVVAIWVGSLDERKDPLAAVRAAREAGVLLLVVGDGPLRSQVERAAGARVRVLGRRADVPRLLAAADLYVLTSRREGLALSLLEAMAAGLAPVVTDLPENREAVGDAGVAVPPGDADELAAAIERLVGNEAERAHLGALALRRVAGLFSADETISRTRALYDDVLAGRGAPGR
jgi:glycosyltransferase involved in cell wall biosynthesis